MAIGKHRGRLRGLFVRRDPVAISIASDRLSGFEPGGYRAGGPDGEGGHQLGLSAADSTIHENGRLLQHPYRLHVHLLAGQAPELAKGANGRGIFYDETVEVRLVLDRLDRAAILSALRIGGIERSVLIEGYEISSREFYTTRFALGPPGAGQAA